MWPAFDAWNRKSLSEGPFKFIVDEYDRLNPDSAALTRIEQPVLVAVGDGDPFLSVADAAAGRSQLRAGQLLVVPGATHPAYRERPEVFLPALDALLAAKA